MPGHTTKLAIPLLILLCAVAAHAEVRLPAIISDNMVLQQGTKVRIWGSANPKERITVAFDQKSATTVANDKGKWELWIGPLQSGGPSELIVKGDNIITIKNVLVGEVW